jgi:hypothetical protein
VAEVSIRGGARIGWVNSTWPFARLTSAADRLTIASLGRYEFSREQVVSIERYNTIPFLGGGIRINHNRSDYPEKVIFWCVGDREKTIAQIRQSGFQAKGKAGVRAAGFPIRVSVLVILAVLWNAFFMLDSALSSEQWRGSGPFVLVALLMLLGFATAVQASTRLQHLVLREGHYVGEITALLRLLQVVCGILSVVFAVTLLAHVFAS